ncbi:MAG: acyl-CoA reductase, partial [Bdellovibrionota bacterium]
NNQQACSSPQIAYVEADNFEELCAVAEKIVPLMKDVDLLGATALDEQSEITTQTLMQFYESLIPDTPAKTKIYEGPKKNWRLFVTTSPQLETSPLYKTLWIKPCPSDWNILAPYRAYLQTCGLAASPENFPVLARNLFSAGITRIRPLGQMTEDHVGEPHDGEYGLLRFLRRVSMQSEFFYAPSRGLTTPITLVPLMDKAAFQKANQRDIHTDLYFKSGGSSGTPALSRFTYRDYHLLMSFAAKGLIAAGLNPKDDLCMNLFFGGGLYGGFLSFYTILEKIGVPQLPMSAHLDFQYVAQTIQNLKPNVLLGMPSYLISLFTQFGHLFKDNCPIKKIYFGGEHFPALIREQIKKEFGIEIIKSASYGSVDAGPLGYQCQYTGGTLHHLHNGLHQIEVLDLEIDRPAESGHLGRLVVSTPMRESSLVQRYVVGDTGILTDKQCLCGSSDILFDLKGRLGDVFKAGGSFLNYQKFA